MDTLNKKQWFERWWVWMIIILGTLIAFAALGFYFQVREYVGQFESGELAYPKEFTRGFEENDTQQTITRSDIETDDDPHSGPRDARLVIVGFEDFECPFCKKAFPIIREVTSKYRDRVKFIYRDFPISEIHARAIPAALAAECAHEQGKFWEYHDKLFANQPDFSNASLARYAREVNLDITRFNRCYSSQKYLREVQEDFSMGLKAGVTGTPTWFINGQRVSGVIPLEVWEVIIESELKK